MRKCLFLKVVISLIVMVVCFMAAQAQNRSYTVQVASLENEVKASRLVKKLRDYGIYAYWVRANIPNTGTRYRVRIGRFATQQTAQQWGEQVCHRGIIHDFFITSYEALTPPTIVTGQQSRSMNSIRSVNFRDFTYPTSNRCVDAAGGRNVKVSQGKSIHSRDKHYGPVGFRVAKITYGDLTNDGVEEAVIATHCGFIGNVNLPQSPWADTYVYTLQNGKPHLLAMVDWTTYEPNYQRYYQDGTILFYGGPEGIINGKLLLGAWAGQGRCCPEYEVSMNLRWNGQRFITTEKPGRKKRKR